MTMQLSNYLFVTTMCEDALTFYAECGLSVQRAMDDQLHLESTGPEIAGSRIRARADRPASG